VAFLTACGSAHAASRPRPALTRAPADALARALAAGDLSEAQYALERALSLFDYRAVTRRYGHVVRPDGHEATLLLRDQRATAHGS
jgi:hypothetical protein